MKCSLLTYVSTSYALAYQDCDNPVVFHYLLKKPGTMVMIEKDGKYKMVRCYGEELELDCQHYFECDSFSKKRNFTSDASDLSPDQEQKLLKKIRENFGIRDPILAPIAPLKTILCNN